MIKLSGPQWSKRDAGFFSLGAMLFLSSLYILVTDYSPFLDRWAQEKHRAHLANLADKKNQVRRKSADVIYWEDIQQNTALYDQDLLYTHPGSEAIVNFLNRSQISVNENTMIKIELIEQDASIEVLEGKLMANLTGGALWLKTKDGQLRTQGENTQFEFENGKISVLQGQLNLDSKDGKLKLDQGKELELKTGNIQTMIIAINGPTGTKTRYIGPSDDAEISWHSPKKAQSYRVTVAKDQQLQEIVYQQTSASPKTPLVGIGEGQYYVLVEALDEKGNVISESLKTPITWKKAQAPLLVSPAKGETIVLSQTEAKIHFTWETTGPKEYELELVEGLPNESGGHELFSVRGNSEDVEVAESGEYSWRIRPRGEGMASELWSEWRSFRVLAPNEQDRPQDLSPKMGSKIVWEDAVEGIEFEWESENGKAFIFNIGDREGQHRTKKQAKSTQLIWKPKVWGLYRWNVDLDMGAKGSKIITSETHTLFIAPPKLNDLSPSDGSNVDQGQNVELSWESLENHAIRPEDIEGYVVQIAQDKDFEALVFEQESKTPNVRWNAEISGSYFWRVVGKSNGQLTAWSEAQELEVEKGRSLSAGSSVEEIARPYKWDVETRYLTLQQRINDTKKSIYAKLKEDSPVGIGVKVKGRASGLTRPWQVMGELNYSMIKDIPEGEFGPYIRSQVSATKVNQWAGFFGPALTAGYESFKNIGYNPAANNLRKKTVTAIWFPGLGLDFNFHLFAPSWLRLEGAVSPLAQASFEGGSSSDDLMGILTRGTYEATLWDSAKLLMWAQMSTFTKDQDTIEQTQTGASLGWNF